MDKSLLVSRFSKAIETYDDDAKIQQEVALQMLDLLCPYCCSKIHKAVEIGCGTGFYSRLIANTFQPEIFILNDICHTMETMCNDIFSRENYTFIEGDAEVWDLPPNIDLLTSCSTFQWFQHPARFFQKAYEKMNQNGIFAFSTYGNKNLDEVATLTGNALPYNTLDELSEMLHNADFSIILAKEEIRTLVFKTPLDVLYHMKRTGINGVSSVAWTKETVRRFSEEYMDQFSNKNNEVILTYHPIYFIAKKQNV